jgi:hypothetical protein
MLFRQRIRAVTHVVELPSSAQDSARMDRIHGSQGIQEKKASDALTWFMGFEGGFVGLYPDSNSPQIRQYDRVV